MLVTYWLEALLDEASFELVCYPTYSPPWGVVLHFPILGSLQHYPDMAMVVTADRALKVTWKLGDMMLPPQGWGREKLCQQVG